MILLCPIERTLYDYLNQLQPMKLIIYDYPIKRYLSFATRLENDLD